MAASKTPILIVGAGPSGLVLAHVLLQNGIKPRIIHKESEWRVGQKGSGVQPRSLELYRIMGLYRDIASLSDVMQPLRMYVPGTQVPLCTWEMMEYSANTPDCPDMNALLLGQDRHEAVLRAKLERLGCVVEKATELKKFVQHDDHVEVELHKTTNDLKTETETARFHWVVGCDGGQSTVRKLLGLNFLGETRNGDNLVIGDIEVEEGLDRGFWHFWGEPAFKTVYMLPFEEPDSKYFSFVATGTQFDHQLAALSREEFLKNFYEVSGRTDIKFGKLISLSNYVPTVRMVDSFGQGRVLLAGDACHTHPPTGGQGLNSGLQDSGNLGWKLALVHKGLAPKTLLDTYSSERLPVIAAMLRKTSALLTKTLKVDPEAAWKRGFELRQLGVNYRGSSIILDESPSATPDEEVDPYGTGGSGEFVRAGDRAPDAPGIIPVHGPGTRTIFGLFKISRHVVLVFGSEKDAGDEVVAAVKAYPTDTVVTAVVIPAGTPFKPAEGDNPDYVLSDVHGYAYKHYKTETRALKIVIVRPDGVIGAVVAGVDGVKKYFSNIFK